MEKFAIIGFGCAGYHALSAVRESGCTARIDIYSDTDMPPYNPMLTTYYAAGRLPYDGLFPFGTLSEIAEQKQASIITNTRVSAVHARKKTVVTEDGRETTGYTVRFADGSSIETQLLVLNIGTRASTGILSAEEVLIERGIVTDEHMRTSVPDIYAAGDCCQGCNLQSGKTMIIGLWANAGIQGRVAGRNMAGVSEETDGNILHNITHFLDMDFIGLGDNRLTGEVSAYQSPDKGFYLQAVLRGGKPAGFNILDNYGVSGILKSHLIKVLRGQPGRFTPEQRGQLIRYGLEEYFIDKLEGKQ